MLGTSEIVFFAVLSQGVLCQIPNVYEFCSALMSDRHRSETTACSPNDCTARPGKRGHPGIRGQRGLKGERGEPGTCDGLLERQVRFEEEIAQKFALIPKLQYCSMGMKSGDIPDESITASNAESYSFHAFNGRLDARVLSSSPKSITNAGAWCAPSTNDEYWIQVDLGKLQSVAGVVTQGRPKNGWGNQNWVKTFKISCGLNSSDLHFITGENGSDKIFIGNSDKDTKVTNKFPAAITCRVLRLYPLTWNTDSPWVGICLRMEVLRGECFDML